MSSSPRSWLARESALAVLPLLLVAIWLVGGCAADSVEAPPESRASLAQTTATPPYFRVEGGPGATLLVMGTIHLGPAEGWRFSSEVEEVETADRFVLEIDPRAIDEAELGDALANRVVLPPSTTLSDVVSPATAKLLAENDEALGELGLPANARKRLKPWYLAVGLIESATGRSGYPVSQSADGAILAALRNRPLEGLETFDAQLALLDGLSPRLQDLMLHDTLARLDETVSELERLMNAWASNDIETLGEIAYQGVDEMPELEEFYEVLLGERNRRWLVRLREILDDPRNADTTVFVGVGALHLTGKDSLVRMLQNAGYRVEALHPVAHR